MAGGVPGSNVPLVSPGHRHVVHGDGDTRGVELLASVVADTVETYGSAFITSVPAEHLEAVRRAARRHLRDRGFRSQTYVVNAVVHIMSDDAFERIDPSVSQGWVNEALTRIDVGESGGAHPVAARHGVDWHTWVVDV